MTAKHGEEFLYEHGYYNDDSVAIKGIYARYGVEAQSVRVLKFNPSYNDDGRKKISYIYINFCSYPNLKKLIVPTGVGIEGKDNLPYGCVIERY